MANPHSRALELFLCVVVVPLLLLAILWIPLERTGLQGSADFIQFYSAGKIVASDHYSHLYDPVLQSDMQWEIARREEPTLFNHPPFEAVLYAPLAQFSYGTAFGVWTFLNLSCLGLVFFLLRTYGPPFELTERLLLIAAAFYPVLATIVQGQDSLLILLAYVGSFLLLRAGRDFLAGLLLGIALVKPQLVIPFALLLLLRGRWKFVAGLTASASALVILSLLLVGPAAVIRYPLLILEMNGHARAFHVFPETMPNLRGLLTLLVPASLPSSVLNLLVAAISFAVLVWVNRNVARRRNCFDLSFSLAVVATLLLSFHLLIHDLSLLILPVFLLLHHLQLVESFWTRFKILRVAPLALLFLTFFAMQFLGLRAFSVAAIPVLGIAFAIAVTPASPASLSDSNL